jgi:hypothetical protein
MTIIISIATFVGLAGGNFVWQAVNGQNWQVAFERSLFQAVAIIALLGFLKVVKRI